ncbi:cytochrome p450 domain-containing protein [Ditylenchus destructor]|uniref:Cytochrome p450 domain-containing protein n=1 Tax=Ditylenchus destructor TaxID=166010 RepID=A0AAD4QY69_9BILA|nr:cytochrome p450 domain-containing protein [Ditylenchus destructor]
MIVNILVLLFVAVCFYNFYWKRRNYPPGPTPLPLIGNLFQLKFFGTEKCINDFHKKYGDLYTIWFGEMPVVSLGSYDLIQEQVIKNSDAYAGRPDLGAPFNEVRGGKYGIVITDGPLWRDQRRFALHVLRNFGLGKNLMQERVLAEVSWLVDELKNNHVIDKTATEVDVPHLLERAVGSIINRLVFGYSFNEHGLEEFHEIKSAIRAFQLSVQSPLFRMFTGKQSEFLKHLPGLSGFYKTFMRNAQRMNFLLQRQLDKRKKTVVYDEAQEPTDYVEAFLKEQAKREAAGEKDHGFTDKQLFGAIIDLWLAGQETTTSTLEWFLLYSMSYPETQSKMHAELDRVIGEDRIITQDEKQSLHYVNAIVAETQRYCNLLVINLLHRLTEEVHVRGYTLPANTAILPQLTTILYDPNVFENPKEFRPERFLDAEGKFMPKSELIPFSAGKRSCLGEGLARLELFLFAANLFNQFEFSKVPGKPLNMASILTITNRPHPFTCCVRRRF